MKNSLHSKSNSILTTVFSFVLIYLIAFTVFKVNNNSLVFPNPNNVLNEFFVLLSLKQTYKLIFSTLLRLLLTLSISFILGVILGVVASLSRNVEGLLKPYVTIIRSLPVVVLLVFFVMVLGFQLTPYFLTCFVLIPLFYEATLKGIKSIDSDYLDVCKMEGNFNFKIIRRVLLPMSAGYIGQALISAIGLGFKVLVVGEYMSATKNSLGNVIYSNAHNLEYIKVYAWCIILICLVLIVEALPKVIIKIRGILLNVVD